MQRKILETYAVIVVVDVNHVAVGISLGLAVGIGFIQEVVAVFGDLAVAALSEQRQHEAADQLVEQVVERGTVAAVQAGTVVDIKVEHGKNGVHKGEHRLQEVAHHNAQAVTLQEVQTRGQYGGENILDQSVVNGNHHWLAGRFVEYDLTVIVKLFGVFGLHDLLKEAERHVEQVFHLELFGGDTVELALLEHMAAGGEIGGGVQAHAFGKALEVVSGEQLVHAKRLKERNDGAVVTV